MISTNETYDRTKITPKIRINRTLDLQISETLAENNRENLRKGVAFCQRAQYTGPLFRLIAKMSGKKPSILPNKQIAFNNRQVTIDEKITISFCKQFTTRIPHTSNSAARRIVRQLLCDSQQTLSCPSSRQNKS